MEFIIGHEINGYKLLERIGSGGMGAVYRAYHQTMKRDVAIKFLSLDYADDPQHIGRFNREAETLAQLEHAHIVPIYDYGTYHNFSYIVMRLLVGGSLYQLLRTGNQLPLPQVARIFQQVTSALQYAHQRGVIHRDIKANNVMLDDAGNAYLADFGIAKLMFETTQFTTAGSTLGTPMYMAPELWKGADSSVQTDIYSLGILLYQTLTNTMPFTASTPYGLMDKHLHEMPKPVSALRDDVFSVVDEVIWQALAKLPAERYADVETFAENLEYALLNQNYPADYIETLQVKNVATPKAMPAPKEEDQQLTPIVDVNSLKTPLLKKINDASRADSTPPPTSREDVVTWATSSVEKPLAEARQRNAEVVDEMADDNLTNESAPNRSLLKVGGLLFIALIVVVAGFAFMNGSGEEAGDKQVVQATASPTLNSPTPDVTTSTIAVATTDTSAPTVVAVVNEIEPDALGLLYGQDASDDPEPVYADEIIVPTEDSLLVLMREDADPIEVYIQADAQVSVQYDEELTQYTVNFADDGAILLTYPDNALADVHFVYEYAEETFPLAFDNACTGIEYRTATDTLTSTLTTYCLGEDSTCQVDEQTSIEAGDFMAWELATPTAIPLDTIETNNLGKILDIYTNYHTNRADAYAVPDCLLAYLEGWESTETPTLTVTGSPRPTHTTRPRTATATIPGVAPTSSRTTVPPTPTPRPPTSTSVPPTPIPPTPVPPTPVPPTPTEILPLPTICVTTQIIGTCL